MKPLFKQYVRLISMVVCLIVTGCASHRAAVKPAAAEPNTADRQRVYFDFGRATIREQDKTVLDKVASHLQSDKKSMAIVEGHAVRIGSFSLNEILAGNRARAVRVYLRDQGADPRRMTMTSKGSREPLVMGRTPEELQPNRRVEILWGLTRREDDENR